MGVDILRGHVSLRGYTAPAAPKARTDPTTIAFASFAAAPAPLPLLAPNTVAAQSVFYVFVFFLIHLVFISYPSFQATINMSDGSGAED